MKIDLQAIADSAARRLGFKRATEIVADARRRYGAKVVKAVRGFYKSGKWQATLCRVAVPSHWLDEPEPEPQRLARPTVHRGITLPTPESWAKFRKYNRLLRFNSHAVAMKYAYGIENDNAESLMQDFVKAGVLKMDLSAIKPRKVQKPAPKQKWLSFWKGGN